MYTCEQCANLQQWHACSQTLGNGTSVRLGGPLIRAICDLCGRYERCYCLSRDFQEIFPSINPHLHMLLPERRHVLDPQPCTDPERTHTRRSRPLWVDTRLTTEDDTHQLHDRYAVYTQPVINRVRLMEALEEFRLQCEEQVGDDPS